MKKIVNRFTKLDRTKKIVIIFIAISFVVIVCFGIYHSINPNTSTNDKVKEISKEVNKTKKNLDKTSTKEETNNIENEDTTDNSKQTDSSSSTTAKESTSTSNDSSTTLNNQNTNNSSANKKATINIYVQIIGVDNKTLSSGYIDVEEKSSVFNALISYGKYLNIDVEYNNSFSGPYVTGIAGLKEYQYGNSSGWMYMVNNVSPNTGCGSYILSGNESVVWYYVNYN